MSITGRRKSNKPSIIPASEAPPLPTFQRQASDPHSVDEKKLSSRKSLSQTALFGGAVSGWKARERFENDAAGGTSSVPKPSTNWKVPTVTAGFGAPFAFRLTPAALKSTHSTSDAQLYSEEVPKKDERGRTASDSKKQELSSGGRHKSGTQESNSTQLNSQQIARLVAAELEDTPTLIRKSPLTIASSVSQDAMGLEGGTFIKDSVLAKSSNQSINDGIDVSPTNIALFSLQTSELDRRGSVSFSLPTSELDRRGSAASLGTIGPSMPSDLSTNEVGKGLLAPGFHPGVSRLIKSQTERTITRDESLADDAEPSRRASVDSENSNFFENSARSMASGSFGASSHISRVGNSTFSYGTNSSDEVGSDDYIHNSSDTINRLHFDTHKFETGVSSPVQKSANLPAGYNNYGSPSYGGGHLNIGDLSDSDDQLHELSQKIIERFGGGDTGSIHTPSSFGKSSPFADAANAGSGGGGASRPSASAQTSYSRSQSTTRRTTQHLASDPSFVTPATLASAAAAVISSRKQQQSQQSTSSQNVSSHSPQTQATAASPSSIAKRSQSQRLNEGKASSPLLKHQSQNDMRSTPSTPMSASSAPYPMPSPDMRLPQYDSNPRRINTPPVIPLPIDPSLPNLGRRLTQHGYQMFASMTPPPPVPQRHPSQNELGRSQTPVLRVDTKIGSSTTKAPMPGSQVGLDSAAAAAALAAGLPVTELPNFQFSPLSVQFPTPEPMALGSQNYGALVGSETMLASVRPEKTIPVFVYLPDETCSMYTVPPHTTINELRMESQGKTGNIDLLHMVKIYLMGFDVHGSPTETKLDPNTIIDHIKVQPPATIKLRLRPKAELRWTIPVSIPVKKRQSTASAATKTRWIVVSKSMTVDQILQVLCTVEGIDDEESYGLWTEGTKEGHFLNPQETPFEPWERTARFSFRRSNIKRSAKLAGILGLPSDTDFEALVSKESSAAETIKRRDADVKRQKDALRNQKLSYILGFEGQLANTKKDSDSEQAIPGASTSGLAADSKDELKPEKEKKFRSPMRSLSMKPHRKELSESDALTPEPARKKERQREQPNIKRERMDRPKSASHTISGLEKTVSQMRSSNNLSSSNFWSSDSPPIVKLRRPQSVIMGKKAGLDGEYVGHHARHSVAGELISRGEEEKAETVEPEKRKEKLADFFGIAKQKEMDVIQNLISKHTVKQDKSIPEANQTESNVIIRVNFGNLTYSNLCLPMSCLVNDAKQMIIRKLLLKENSDMYGMYVCVPSTGHESELKSDEKIYEAMLKWTDNEYFMFKRKSTKNWLRHKEQMNDYPSYDSTMTLEEPRNSKARVAKLAGFFGVTPGNEENLTEYGELFKIFKELASPLIPSSHKAHEPPQSPLPFSSNFKTQARPIQIPTTLYKEGWVQLHNPQKKSWTSHWANLENQLLILRPSTRNEAVMPLPAERDTGGRETLRVSLENCVVQTFEQQVYKKSRVFAIQRKKGERLVMCAGSDAEFADWVNCVKLSTRVSFSTPAESGKDVAGAGEQPAQKENQSPVDPSKLQSELEEEKQQQKLTMESFEIHRVIGRGKFAKVLLCSRKSTKKVYAIKVLTKPQNFQSNPTSPTDPRTESAILRSIHHPFIVGLHYAFQSHERLYLVMEYINGGELYFHVSHFGRFAEERVRFYAAELFLGLDCLHGKGILYRDLKLENILLTEDGHVKITDFGLSKQEEDMLAEEVGTSDTISVVGTLEYLAPEVLEGYPHSQAADYWAYGVVVFEMLCGFHPFYSEDREDIRLNILDAPIDFPGHVHPVAQDFISQLLQRDPTKRMIRKSIQQHEFFKGVDWVKLFNKEVDVPFRPVLRDELDVSFFDGQFTDEPAQLTPSSSVGNFADVDGFSFRGRNSISSLESLRRP
ncbi:hypothetical protein DFS34DRAFT_609584 [Phlyctochytrium arcticum]|nr:hypothetical protein DFS34DRAFT_609584 [Phlyctochytrium arcticum]